MLADVATHPTGGGRIWNHRTRTVLSGLFPGHEALHLRWQQYADVVFRRQARKGFECSVYGYEGGVPSPTNPESSYPVTIKSYPDGPYLVRGDFVLEDAEDGTIPVTRSVIALCRCGRSRTAPMCDGSHRVRPRPASS